MGDTTPTALYRMYDKGGLLLYVGISVNPPGRFAAHARGSHWFGSVANITVEWCPSRRDAEIAEITAIATENPQHNKSRPRPPRFGPKRPAQRRRRQQRPVVVASRPGVAERDLWVSAPRRLRAAGLTFESP